MNYAGVGALTAFSLIYGKVFRAQDNIAVLNQLIDCISEQMFNLRVETHPHANLRYKRDENNQSHPKHRDVARILASSFLGLRVAFESWVENKNNFHEIPFPNPLKKLTIEQLFYLNYAQSWCYQNFKHIIEKYLNYSFQHPFDYYHVIIPLMNDPQFEQVFKCKKGHHKMSPENTCRSILVWNFLPTTVTLCILHYRHSYHLNHQNDLKLKIASASF